jgi:hypothetical protein
VVISAIGALVVAFGGRTASLYPDDPAVCREAWAR